MMTEPVENNPAVPSGKSAFSTLSSIVLRVLPWTAVVGLLLMIAAPAFLVPAEDATILFQYSDNLATTGEITYFHGGPRVEGATDFLWMVLLAGFRVLHIPPVWAVAALNVFAAIAISWLILRLCGKTPTARSMLPPLGLVMLAPQLGAAFAGFSVLPFAALLLLCAVCFFRKHDAGLALSCFVLCLFRPDGVVFAFPLLALSLFDDRRGRLKRLGIDLLLFVLPGVVYFVWRWHYFGQLLPLPFLVKSDTRRFLGIALSDSNVDILKYLAFDTLLLGMVFGRRLLERTNLRLLLALGVVPTIFYLSMRLDQDIADRFFTYFLVCSAVLIAVNWSRLPAARTIATAAILWIVFLGFTWAFWMIRFVSDGYHNNVVAIARQLRDVSPHGKLALSEAGRIAYFSEWPTVDLWGLNTPEFAHRLFQPGDVAAVSPDVLVLYYPQTHHDCRFQSGWDTPHTVRTWPNLAQNVITGVHDDPDYDLWMVPSSGILRHALDRGRPAGGEYQCWFIKRDFAGHDQVVNILERHAALPAAEFFRLRFGTPVPPPPAAPTSAVAFPAHVAEVPSSRRYDGHS